MREESRMPRSEVFRTPKLIQLFRYIQFLGKFQRYLSVPIQEECGQYVREWRLPRFSEVQRNGWLEKLKMFELDVNFSEELDEWFQSAEKRYDPHLLSLVVERALKEAKRSNVLVWGIFELRKIIRR